MKTNNLKDILKYRHIWLIVALISAVTSNIVPWTVTISGQVVGVAAYITLLVYDIME